jgi:hypothetical protein
MDQPPQAGWLDPLSSSFMLKLNENGYILETRYPSMSAAFYYPNFNNHHVSSIHLWEDNVWAFG